MNLWYVFAAIVFLGGPLWLAAGLLETTGPDWFVLPTFVLLIFAFACLCVLGIVKGSGGLS